MYLVSTYYAEQGVLAQIGFDSLTEEEHFFCLQINQSGKEAVKVWLKKQQGLFEQYLLDYYKRDDRQAEINRA